MTAIAKAARWIALGLSLAAAPAAAQHRGRLFVLDVPFKAAPEANVAAMLRLAGVGPSDTVYDLGSGDGRIVIAAVCDFAAKAGVGVELDSRLVRASRAKIDKAGLTGRVRIIEGDVFKADFSAATVVTLYMSARINNELLPRLTTLLKPGSRVVALRFPVGDWEPVKKETVGGLDIRLYVVRKGDSKRFSPR